MKTLKCTDMGVACSYSASGNTAEEAKKKMMGHAAKAHKEMLEKMTPDEKARMEKKMDELLAK